MIGGLGFFGWGVGGLVGFRGCGVLVGKLGGVGGWFVRL